MDFSEWNKQFTTSSLTGFLLKQPNIWYLLLHSEIVVNVFIYFHMLRYHFYSMRTKVISVSRNYWTAMTGSLFFLFWYTCFWWRHAVFYSVRNRRLIVLARQILFSWSMSCLGSFEPTVCAALIFPFRFVWGDRRKRSKRWWLDRRERKVASSSSSNKKEKLGELSPVQVLYDRWEWLSRCDSIQSIRWTCMSAIHFTD